MTKYKVSKSKIVLGRNIYHRGDVFDTDDQTGRALVAGGLVTVVPDGTATTKKSPSAPSVLASKPKKMMQQTSTLHPGQGTEDAAAKSNADAKKDGPAQKQGTVDAAAKANTDSIKDKKPQQSSTAGATTVDPKEKDSKDPHVVTAMNVSQSGAAPLLNHKG